MGLQDVCAANDASIQRGADFFMNYCSGCHALKYMRPDQKILAQDLTQISLPARDAQHWFGKMPPDLSLTARERGPAWVYAYLTHFYPDPSRPFGANNTWVPDVAMPNVLAPLKDVKTRNADLHDVVSFLVYVAEPMRGVRHQMGLVVMGFLAVLGALIYRLKTVCWRNISD